MFYKLSALKNNKNVDMSSYLGKVILIVNSASKCGFTNQYKELEEIYRRIGNSKFEILAFPSNQFLNRCIVKWSATKNKSSPNKKPRVKWSYHTPF